MNEESINPNEPLYKKMGQENKPTLEELQLALIKKLKEYGETNHLDEKIIFEAVMGKDIVETEPIMPIETKVEDPISVPETEHQEKENILVFNPRKGFEPNLEPQKIEEVKEEVVAEPEVKPEPAPIVETPTPESVIEKVEVPISVQEKIFDNPEILKDIEVKEGDSLWIILKKIFENGSQFKDITEAQKIFVLNKISGLIFDEPEVYGLNKDGSLEIGKKIDLSKILNDNEKVGSIIKEAKETIIAGSLIEKSTLKLPESVQISKPEPKTEVPVEPEIKPIPEPISEIKPEIKTEIPVPVPEPPKVQEMSVLEKEKREAIHKQIEEAKQRLNHLESSAPNSNLERSLSSDTRFVAMDSKFNQTLEEAFKNEINEIYGKSGLLGMGKTEGLKTKEWAEMARLPAIKVIEYYTGDSNKSGLSPETIKELLKSKNHEALMRQTAGLMEQSHGAIKPFENENMEQFIKRLGGYVLRTHSQKS
ncbi:MAG: hypothetical protein AAB446_02405 [Patescibacteria group bacterium]